MRYVDEQWNYIPEPDMGSGYGEGEKKLIAHHDAEEAVPDIGHYEVIHVYPNGGKDVEWIVDVPGHPYIPAWDEYEDVIMWHFYPPPPPPEPVRADRNYLAGEIAVISGTWYEILENIPANCKITSQNAKEISLEDYLNSLKETNT